MESSVSPARVQAEWHMLCWHLITTQPVGGQESPEEKQESMLLGHRCSAALQNSVMSQTIVPSLGPVQGGRKHPVQFAAYLKALGSEFDLGRSRE